jgi:hypothetical protein
MGVIDNSVRFLPANACLSPCLLDCGKKTLISNVVMHLCTSSGDMLVFAVKFELQLTCRFGYCLCGF